MANHKQAVKRHKQSLKRRLRNRAVLSELRTIVKKAQTSLAEGGDGALVKLAIRTFDRAASKGVLHKRTAARRISRMMRAQNRARAR